MDNFLEYVVNNRKINYNYNNINQTLLKKISLINFYSLRKQNHHSHKIKTLISFIHIQVIFFYTHTSDVYLEGVLVIFVYNFIVSDNN